MPYVDPFTSSSVNPSDVSYRAVALSANVTLGWPSFTATGDIIARTMDVTPSGAGLAITLPAANQASTGEDTLIRNLSADTFTVKDAGGNTVTTVATGQSKYVYLTDNSTANGTWAVVAFGVGSSTVDAASLAGYGIIASGSTLNQSHPTTEYSGNYTVTAADRAKVLIDTVGITFALPDPATVGNNFFVLIKNGGSGTTTLDPAGAATIDGAATISLNPDESLLAVSTGLAYFSVGRGRSNTFSFTQLTKAMVDGTTTLNAAEYGNKILYFTNGTATAATTVVLPNTVTIWYVFNFTNYSMTVKTALGTGISIPAGGSAIVYGTGTDIINAVTVSTPSTTFGAGTVTVPSIAFTADPDTGLYNSAANEVAVTAAGNNIATFTTGGLLLTTDLAVSEGGTGASTAAAARTALGVAIGTDVQAYDADLAALAALGTTGLIERTGAGTASTVTVTAFAKTVLDDADAATVRTTIGAQASGSYASSGTNSDITSLSAVTALTNASGVDIKGTNTNDATAQYYVGEYIEGIGTNVSAPTSTQYGDLASIALTAGDWDVSAFISASTAGGTVTVFAGGIGTATGNSSTGLVSGDTYSEAAPNSVSLVPITIPPKRISLAGSATYYLKMSATYSAGTPKFYGRISARRVR